MATNINKQDRIAMSKKIVEIPDQNKIVDDVIQQIKKLQAEAIKNDALNAAVQLPYDEKINAYQLEFNYIDAKKRSVLTEDIINSAAKLEVGNGFYLANPQSPIPSVPSGVWKFFSPMSYTYAIGKEFDETYSVEPLGEEPFISNINGLISQVESFIEATRASGKKCETGGSCTGETPPGSGTTEGLCIANGGTWEATGTIVPSPEIQAVIDDLKIQIQNWEDSLNAQYSSIVLPEPEVPVREAENQAAYDDITNSLAIINSWQSIQDFDTSTTLPDNCPDFENMGYVPFCSGEDNPPQLTEAACLLDNGTWIEAFQDSKLSPTQIQILKDEIAARTSFIATRKAQLESYFGDIVQDANTGKLTSYTGWYGERFLIIDSRINLISGSANGKFGAEKSIETQLQIKDSNATTAAAYGLVMLATKAVAPGIDTNYLNVLSSDGFNVGDRVYVVANDQEELSGSISEIIGNRIKLTFKIAKKYTTSNKTRLYKILNNII